MNASELRGLAEQEKRLANTFECAGKTAQANACYDRAAKLEAQAKQAARRERIQWRD